MEFAERGVYKMKIRKATLKDIPELDNIYVRGVIDEVKLQSPKRTKKNILKELGKRKKDRIKGFKDSIISPKKKLIVIKEKESIIGLGEAEIKDFDKTKAEITKIYIDKNNRKKGLGSKLMKELLKWLKKKKVKSVTGGIFIKNEASINLCKKFGFKDTAIRVEKRLT